METVVGKDKRGMIVNRIFGEGANPLMRLIRQALKLVKLPSEEILRHGYKRVVYGVALATNFREILLGLNKKPKYYLSMKNPQKTTKLLAKYWIERWLLRRIDREEVIDDVKKHTLIHPINHGARVRLPEIDTDNLF